MSRDVHSKLRQERRNLVKGILGRLLWQFRQLLECSFDSVFELHLDVRQPEFNDQYESGSYERNTYRFEIKSDKMLLRRSTRFTVRR